MDTMNCDVAVVGAGPAGCVVARTCAEAGYNTILFEKNRVPGLKVCGGFLEPRIIEEFEIDPRVIDYHIDRFFLHTKNHNAVLKASDMFGYEAGATMRREKFDAWLADKAVEAGAALHTSSRCLRSIIKNGKVAGIKLAAKKSKKEFKAKITVAADGFYSTVARSAGLIPKYSKKDFMIGFQREVYLKTPLDKGEVHVFLGNMISRCGYGWLFPKMHGFTAGVGSLATQLTDTKTLSNGLNWFLEKHPVCSDLVKNAKNISKPKLACIPISQHRNLSCNGLVTVGDAAGQVSPTTGGGIYYAMKAAEIVSEVIIQSLETGDNSKEFLRRYDSKWRVTLGKDLHFERLLFDMSRIHYTSWQELMLLINKNLISSTLVAFALFCLKTALPCF
ncbi:MAG: NAD(P)/FAD-dependent oxidoreductase [Candidatus Bathyarchaeota archaeon]|nr:NAD(P)/FAD-dependent oxidoreductase [Candidatus Bathyarchaeota archaeon]MDH5732619.1 NAD(P)/FAD-dependent oxidoreductase [Candidatus Bathyarchaeota archaeon]